MKIIETRRWNVLDVRLMCVREVLYTKGSDEEYTAMLEIVEDESFPTLEDIYRVAEDINRHSEDQTVTNIMYMLVNSVVKSTFEIEEDEDRI